MRIGLPLEFDLVLLDVLLLDVEELKVPIEFLQLAVQVLLLLTALLFRGKVTPYLYLHHYLKII